LLPLLAAKLRTLGRWILGTDFQPDDPAKDATIERPWLEDWDWIPRRTAGPGFSRHDYREAHTRAVEVARGTLGEEAWAELGRAGFLELPSKYFPGISYRLRVGRRIEVRCAEGTLAPWPYPYLCINPAYPLPEEEFFAQLYLYVRDREEEVIRVAAPQPWDQLLGRTF
jgi:hypothetical protein